MNQAEEMQLASEHLQSQELKRKRWSLCLLSLARSSQFDVLGNTIALRCEQPSDLFP